VLAGAYETNFASSIAYTNVGSATTTILSLSFYDSPSDISPLEIPLTNLNPYASSEVFIGSLTGIESGFQGTAVLISDQPITATLLQRPEGSSAVKVVPASVGFAAGTEDSLIPTVLKNAFGGFYTIFSVQNSGGSDTDVVIKFYDTSATLQHTINQNIESGAGFFVDAGNVSALGSSFNGSVVVDTTGGSIVTSAMEFGSGDVMALNNYASSFEGLGAGASAVYMPSALCEYPIPGGVTNTSYAVQNTSLTASTTVTVNYSNGTSEAKTINPGAKGSFYACEAPGMSTGWLGSSKVTSSDTPIIAIGKAWGMSLSTTFLGFSDGTSKVSLPYVRWADTTNWNNGTQQKVYISLQNIGDTTITGGSVSVKYVDPNGDIAGTHVISSAIAPNAKANSFATDAGLSSFGYYTSGTQSGGGVIIEGPSGSKLAVIARLCTNLGSDQACEDYTGIPLP